MKLTVDARSGMLGRCFRRLAWAAAALAAAVPALADSGHPRAPTGPARAAAAEASARVIVRYREAVKTVAAVGGDTLAAAGLQRAPLLSRKLGLALTDGRALGARMQALRGQGVSSEALAQRLAALPEVEFAVVDRRRSIRGVLPTDPLFGAGLMNATPEVGQWFLRAPDSTFVSATDALGAWAYTQGKPSITVAVLDTGVRFDHPDLQGKLWPGHDFIADTDTARDGDGRDTDASDPGDWAGPGDSCYVPPEDPGYSAGANDSSWHGTQVAGLIAAADDNGLGGTGLARQVMVLPVRVLGVCGGYDSDIIAGMRWAAGLRVDGAPTNPHPAQVLNLSLGSEGSCEAAYQTVMTELTAARVAVVAAAGNEVGHPVGSPANCSGVIAVAGLRHAGTKVGYSNIGPEVTVAAPAGNCVNIDGGPCLYPLLTTTNTGSTTPGSNIFSDSHQYSSLGTSFATPLVAGAAALMLSVDATLSPAQLKSHLQASARPFPTRGAADTDVVACRTPSMNTEQLECYCTTSTCGAGMLDVRAAVARVFHAATTLGITASAPAFKVGQQVSLQANLGAAPATAFSAYAWQITAGADQAVLVGATGGDSVVLQGMAPGTVQVQLLATDVSGQVETATLTLTVAAANALLPTTLAISSPPTSVVAGGEISLQGLVNTDPQVVVSRWSWQLLAGSGQAQWLSGTQGASVQIHAVAAGQVPVRLTVVDSTGASVSDTVTLNITAPAQNGSGDAEGDSGGGALGGLWLLGLAAAAAALRRRG